MPGRLSSKVAVVTGAARGIGLAITGLFRREDASVLATDIVDPPGAAIASLLGDRCAYLPLDVRRAPSTRPIWKASHSAASTRSG